MKSRRPAALSGFRLFGFNLGGFNLGGPPRKRPPMSRQQMVWVTIGSAVLTAFLFLWTTTVLFPLRLHLDVPGTAAGITISTGFAKEKIILVMGVDTNYESLDKVHDHNGTRSDTMMMVRLRPSENTLSLVSIPRDSRVYIGNSQHVDKINAAHVEGGPEMAVETVEKSFGLPIDHHVVVNFSGVRDLVDAIGGVDLVIEKPMHYEDHTAKLFIHFEPGPTHLDGQQAEAFLRFRHDALADIGRIKRQQQFISAVSNKLKSPFILASLPRLVQLGVQYVKTDMSFDELLKLAVFIKNVDMKNIRSATMPGHPKTIRGVSYWCIDKTAAEQTLDRVLLDQESTTALPVRPIRVGILYPKTQLEAYKVLTAQLTQAGYTVACHGRTATAGSSQLLEQTDYATSAETRKLRGVSGIINEARLFYAPPGSTYAAHQCGGGEDYTIIMGGQ
jgi:polyisoprenyl-teichoic acid--peptidoglycan teichoic acid transferase